MRTNWTPEQRAELERIATLDDRRAAVHALAEERGVMADTIWNRVSAIRRDKIPQQRRELTADEIARVRQEYAKPTVDLDRFAASLNMTRSTLDKCVARMKPQPKRSRVLGNSVPHPVPPRWNGHNEERRAKVYAGRCYGSLAIKGHLPVRLGPADPQTSMVGCAADMCAR